MVETSKNIDFSQTKYCTQTNERQTMLQLRWVFPTEAQTESIEQRCITLCLLCVPLYEVTCGKWKCSGSGDKCW